MIVATSAVNHSDPEIGKTGGSTRTPTKVHTMKHAKFRSPVIVQEVVSNEVYSMSAYYFSLGPQDQCHCYNGYGGQTLAWSNDHMSSSKILLPSNIAHMIHQWRCENFRNQTWASNFPDLNPMYDSIFGVVEWNTNYQPYNTKDLLKAVILNVMSNKNHLIPICCCFKAEGDFT